MLFGNVIRKTEKVEFYQCLIKVLNYNIVYIKFLFAVVPEITVETDWFAPDICHSSDLNRLSTIRNERIRNCLGQKSEYWKGNICHMSGDKVHFTDVTFLLMKMKF